MFWRFVFAWQFFHSTLHKPTELFLGLKTQNMKPKVFGLACIHWSSTHVLEGNNIYSFFFTFGLKRLLFIAFWVCVMNIWVAKATSWVKFEAKLYSTYFFLPFTDIFVFWNEVSRLILFNHKFWKYINSCWRSDRWSNL